MLAALDPDLDSVLNLNAPGRLRGGPRPARARDHRRVFGALRRRAAAVAARTLVVAATLARRPPHGLTLDEHVLAALNGDQITRDPETPLAAGDAIAFLAADAGG